MAWAIWENNSATLLRGGAFKKDGTQYPAGWLLSATEAERAALSIYPHRREHVTLGDLQVKGAATTSLVNGEVVTTQPAVDMDIESAKAKARLMVNEWRDKIFLSVFEYGGKWFEANERSSENIDRMYNRATSGSSWPTTAWTAVDDTDLPVDASKMIELGDALLDRNHAAHFAARQAKAAIKAANSVAEVQTAIDSFKTSNKVNQPIEQSDHSAMVGAQGYVADPTINYVIVPDGVL